MGKNTKSKVFIDGSNVFYTQKKLGWSLDWSKVKKLIESEKEILEWKYYVGMKADDEKMPKFLRYLNAIGFNTFTKPLKKSDLQAANIILKEQLRNLFARQTLMSK